MICKIIGHWWVRGAIQGYPVRRCKTCHKIEATDTQKEN